MSLKLCMGNQAIAFGALKAGINVASGYPGVPASEILETISEQVRARKLADLHVEWSTNEKAALEVGIGASFAGARALVTMKQTGLNVASDALISSACLGIKGGLVVVVADDPGPLSSQTEQDTRQFAAFAKIPVLDPSTPEEAFKMTLSAFELSERFRTPVFVRPTTRICHGSAPVEATFAYIPHPIQGFECNPDQVLDPSRGYQGHLKLIERLSQIAAEFSKSPFNSLINTHATAPAHQGIVAGGISYAYLHDALMQLKDLSSMRLFKLGTPFPFPEKLALSFLEGIRELLVLEELEPVLEREFLQLIGKHQLRVKVYGKLSGHTTSAGENSVADIARQIEAALGCDFFAKPIDVTPGTAVAPASPSAPAAAPSALAAAPSALAAPTASTSVSAVPSTPASASSVTVSSAPKLPSRPPVLCAGCPHRASFYVVKQALRGRRVVYSGDIGCHAPGHTMPLDMIDTCVCLGGGVTVPQGLHWAEPDTIHLGFIGDATFFASGLTGVVNAVYNRANVTLCVLDNSTSAMTGSQPHPGTGVRILDDVAGAAGNAARKTDNALQIPTILSALGVEFVIQADPFDLKAAQTAVCKAVEHDGVSAVVFKAPCITRSKPKHAPRVDRDHCVGCRKCIRTIGCPALVYGSDKKMSIDASLCFGCYLCIGICPSTSLRPQTGDTTHE